MKIVALTDIHGRTERLSDLAGDLAAADLLLLCGDLTNFGHRPEAEVVLTAVRSHNPHVLAVPGNCDYPDISAYLAREGINLHATHVVLNGVAFLGLGGSLPCPGHTPNEFTDDELASFLAQAAAGPAHDLPWILVSHQPPRDTALDRVRSGMHVGSRAVGAFIEEHRPLVCFTGHIHEAAGMDSIGPTKIINPGPLHMGSYAYAEVGATLGCIEIRKPP
jgi:Icc-related predicted phosphoesterase